MGVTHQSQGRPLKPGQLLASSVQTKAKCTDFLLIMLSLKTNRIASQRPTENHEISPRVVRGQPACWVAAIPAEGGMGESLLLPNSDELKDKNIVVETMT